MRIILALILMLLLSGCCPKSYIILPDATQEQMRRNVEMRQYEILQAGAVPTEVIDDWYVGTREDGSVGPIERNEYKK